MTVEELRQKALKVVEDDMNRYQEAKDGIPEWEKKECLCADSPIRWCAKCAWLHQFKSVIEGIQNKYWHK